VTNLHSACKKFTACNVVLVQLSHYDEEVRV